MIENRDKDQRCRGKSKLQVVLARKRVLCLGYTLLHERAFLHYFHLNQITSLQHLIRVSFMRQLNQLKIQSTLLSGVSNNSCLTDLIFNKPIDGIKKY